MRLRSDRPDPQLQKARLRRRILSIGFGLFLLICLLGLLFVGLSLGKTNPAEDPRSAVRSSEAKASWVFRPSPLVHALARERLDPETREDFLYEFARIEPALQSHAQILIVELDPEVPKEWVVNIPLRRPQGFYEQAFGALLEDLSQSDDGVSFESGIWRDRVLIAESKAALEAVRDRLTERPPRKRASVSPPAGAGLLRFEGEWKFLPRGMRAAFQEANGALADFEGVVTVEWKSAGAEDFEVVLRCNLTDESDSDGGQSAYRFQSASLPSVGGPSPILRFIPESELE